MNKNALHLICLLVFCGLLLESNLSAQVVARVDSFYMPSLSRTMKLSVVLPEKYNPANRYPVLYLLHGYSGDHTDWLARTKLKEFAKEIPLIIVMPDGNDSWYVNSATESSERFEDYLVQDIPHYVQKLYSIDTSRQAIAGLSMGGYGALMLALRHPSRYRFAGSLSAAITFPRGMNDTTRPAERALFPSLRRAFGDKPNSARSAFDIFFLYRQVPRDSLPYIYMAIGAQDGYRSFLPAHRAFTDLLRTYGAGYEYHETQGMHNWQFWNREIQPLLRKMREVLKF